MFPASSKVARASAPNNRLAHAMQLDGAPVVLPQTGPPSGRASGTATVGESLLGQHAADDPICEATAVLMTTSVAVSSAACGEGGMQVPAHAQPAALRGPLAGAPVHEAPLSSPLGGGGQPPPEDDLSWIWNPGEES